MRDRDGYISKLNGFANQLDVTALLIIVADRIIRLVLQGNVP